MVFFCLLQTRFAVAQSDGESLFQDVGLGDRWLSQIFDFAGKNGQGGSDLLGQMLRIYNLSILVLATMVMLTVLVTLVLESAHHGRVGGQRHSEIWTPIRLVMAIGLLTPIMDGYNGAQVVAIQLAHAGSGLASTLWARFEPTRIDNEFHPSVAAAENPSQFLQQVLIDETCMAGVNLARKAPGDENYGSVTAQAIYRDAHSTSKETQGSEVALSLDGSQGLVEAMTVGEGILTEARGKQLPISRLRIHYNRLGTDDYCGSVEIPAPTVVPGTPSGNQILYLNAFLKIRRSLTNYANYIATKIDAAVSAQKATQPASPVGPGPQNIPAPMMTPGGVPGANGPAVANLPELPQVDIDAAAWNSLAEGFASRLSIAAQKVAHDYIAPELHGVDTIEDQGWAAAGFVFFQGARLSHDNLKAQNYAFSAALPNDAILPAAVRSTGSPANCTPLLNNLFKPDFNCLPEGEETTLAIKVAYNVLNTVDTENGNDPLTLSDGPNGASRRQNQLTAEFTRRGHLDSFLGEISGASDATSTTPIFSLINGGNEMMKSASNFFKDSSTIGSSSGGLSASFILIIFAVVSYIVGIFLAYCLPLYPLIRFFSGILSWLLSLFEALMALPLVVLVNMRSEGEGFFAYSEQGILLLLQMVLRPVLMIVGVVAALTVFNTLYWFINRAIWGIFLGVTGSPGQVTDGGLDNVLGFYGCLLLWTFLVYSLANLAFGMINTIPDRVLLWIGSKKVQMMPGKPAEETSGVRVAGNAAAGAGAAIGQPIAAATIAAATPASTVAMPAMQQSIPETVEPRSATDRSGTRRLSDRSGEQDNASHIPDTSKPDP